MGNKACLHQALDALIKLILPRCVLLEVPAKMSRVQLLPQQIRVAHLIQDERIVQWFRFFFFFLFLGIFLWQY